MGIHVYQFVEDVLTEIMDIFPLEDSHRGGRDAYGEMGGQSSRQGIEEKQPDFLNKRVRLPTSKGRQFRLTPRF